MHVEQSWLFGQAVVVQLNDQNVPCAERLNYLLHFGVGQDEVTVDRGLAAADRLEVDHSRQIERRRR